MRRLFRLAATAIPAFIVTGCATMSVSSHVQRGLDITQYHTYDWGAADALPAGDPRLDRNGFFEHQVQPAVEKQLATRGLVRSQTGTPDLLIHYHASITRRLDVNLFDLECSCSYTDDRPTDALEYEAGTLVLDIVDARTNRVIWRGWAQEAVEDMLDHPDKINEAVTRMLARFPRAL